MKKLICILFLIFILLLYHDSNSQIFRNWVSRFRYTQNNLTWKNFPNQINLDNYGNVYITGNLFPNEPYATNGSALTIELDKCGALFFEESFNMSGYDDLGKDLSFDNSNNLYILNEYFANLSLKMDPYIRKLSNNIQQWNYTGVSSARYEYGIKILNDNSGNVYAGILAQYSYPDVSDDIILIKLNSSGIFQWLRSYSDTKIDFLSDMKMDNSGNLILTGSSELPTSTRDVMVLKYDQNGNLLWERSYSGNIDYDDCGNMITIDNNNNIYITGYCYMTDEPPTKYISQFCLTLKYNANGTLLWHNEILPSGDYLAEGLDIKIKNDNLYVVGKSQTQYHPYGFHYYNFLMAKINPANGQTIWLQTYDCERDEDIAQSVDIDENGNAYILGVVTQNGSHDYCLFKLDIYGNLDWWDFYSNGNTNDTPLRVIYRNNAAYVTGFSENEYGIQEILTIQYSDEWLEDCNQSIKSKFMNNLEDINQFNNNLFAVGDSGVLIKSSDNGTNWELIKTNTKDNFKKIRFNTLGKGFIITDNGSLLYSENEGNNWNKMKISNNSLNDIDISGEHIFISGDNGTLLISENSGNNWSNFSLSINQNITSAKFINNSNGIFISSSGYLYRTSNIGLNWQNINFDAKDIYKLQILNDTNIIGFGKQGKIIKSTNYGYNWQKLQNVFDYDITSSCVIDNIIFLTCSNGKIFFSKNMGENWYESITKNDNKLNAILFINKSSGFAVGNSGKILMSSKPEKVLLSKLTNQKLDYKTKNKNEDIMIYNFPNPANPNTNVYFNLEFASLVKIELYNILGQKISEIKNDILESGNNVIKIDGSFLSSGIYFYKISIKNGKKIFEKTNKFMLIK